MGVAIILAPLMLLFLAAPILYFVIAFFVCKAVGKSATKNTRSVALAITLVIFSIYPAKLYLEYLNFSDLCNNISRPAVNITPIAYRGSIAFVTEGGDFVHEAFVWHEEMDLKLNSYEYAYLVNGKETMRYFCDGNTKKCEYGGDIKSRYMFLVTTANKNSQNIFQSNILVVDRQSEQVLYEANEFVLSGILAAYHGAFIAEPGHRGYLSCGYLDGGIDVWRPNDSNTSRHRYAQTDTMILTTIFPLLKNDH